VRDARRALERSVADEAYDVRGACGDPRKRRGGGGVDPSSTRRRPNFDRRLRILEAMALKATSKSIETDGKPPTRDSNNASIRERNE
jgi:hypothetical protein